MTRSLKTLFALLRLSLGEGRGNPGPPPGSGARIDWDELFALSARQGTVLLAYGGIQHLPPGDQPPRRLKLRWVANVVKGSERWALYGQTVADLSQLFFRAGLDMVVLKGLTICSLYPAPWYREGGDIDIYLFGEADRGDALASSLGLKVQHPTAKHSAFAFREVTVENHRRLFDTASLFRREGALYKKMERMLTTGLTPDDCPETGIGSARELPPGAAALFLVGHTFRHFCNADINARHLCDWTVFFDRRRGEIDLGELERQITELHLDKFVTAINSLCRTHLGFEAPFFAAPDPAGKRERREERRIEKMISRYRVSPRVHIPVVGVVRHIFLRNRLYNEYLGRTAPSEFLLPELKRYAAWLWARVWRRKSPRRA